MSGKAVFKVSARAAAQPARRMSGARGRIRAALVAEFRGSLAGELTNEFQSAAPVDEGGLRDSIEASVGTGGGGATVTVRASPRDPETGYNYLDVTRRGHAGPIEPKGKKALAWGGRGGQGVVVARSRGSHPSVDWVDVGARRADVAVSRASRSIGRVISRVVL